MGKEIWYYFKRRSIHGSTPDTSKDQSPEASPPDAE